jgi:hypothetical protein
MAKKLLKSLSRTTEDSRGVGFRNGKHSTDVAERILAYVVEDHSRAFPSWQ